MTLSITLAAVSGLVVCALPTYKLHACLIRRASICLAFRDLFLLRAQGRRKWYRNTIQKVLGPRHHTVPYGIRLSRDGLEQHRHFSIPVDYV